MLMGRQRLPRPPGQRGVTSARSAAAFRSGGLREVSEGIA